MDSAPIGSSLASQHPEGAEGLQATTYPPCPILDQVSLLQTVHFSLPGQPPSLPVPHRPSPNSPFLILAITP